MTMTSGSYVIACSCQIEASDSSAIVSFTTKRARRPSDLCGWRTDYGIVVGTAV
jgi:hypothetical protein